MEGRGGLKMADVYNVGKLKKALAKYEDKKNVCLSCEGLFEENCKCEFDEACVGSCQCDNDE